MNCINKECNYNKESKCGSSSVSLLKMFECEKRIIPTHTPTYAEEQLEHAQDKENRCYNKTCETRHNNICANDNGLGACIQQMKEPINYEEEYSKLKKENEELKEEYEKDKKANREQFLEIAELKRKHENQRLNIKSEMEENKKLKKEVEELKEKIEESNEEHYKNIALANEDENKELKKTLEDALKEKNWRVSTFTKFNNLRYENIKLTMINKELDNRNIGLQNEIKILKQLNDDFRSSVNENSDLKEKNKEWENEYTEIKEYNQLLEKRHKEDEERIEIQKETIIDLKKQNNQGYMEQMNITLNEKNGIIERQEFNIAQLTNSLKGYSEYTIKMNEENGVLKYKVKILKEVIQNITELL